MTHTAEFGRQTEIAKALSLSASIAVCRRNPPGRVSAAVAIELYITGCLNGHGELTPRGRMVALILSEAAKEESHG